MSIVLSVVERPKTISRCPSMVPDLTENLNENDRPLPSFGGRLRGAGEAQDLQHAVASADGATGPPISIDCEVATIPGARGDGDK